MKINKSKNKPVKLRKKGSSKSSFYTHEELPQNIERILLCSLSIKEMGYSKPDPITKK